MVIHFVSNSRPVSASQAFFSRARLPLPSSVGLMLLFFPPRSSLLTLSKSADGLRESYAATL